jgi:hypothetical protein
MSHTGELSPDFFKLVRILAKKMKPIHNRPDCLSGLTPKQAHVDFKQRMLDTLAVTIVGNAIAMRRVLRLEK